MIFLFALLTSSILLGQSKPESSSKKQGAKLPVDTTLTDSVRIQQMEMYTRLQMMLKDPE